MLYNVGSMKMRYFVNTSSTEYNEQLKRKDLI